MANTYKVLGQSYPAATTATTLYTVPSSTSAVVSTINATNTSSGSDTVRIAIRVAGETLANKQYIAYDVTVPPKGLFTYTAGTSLSAGDIITVYSTNGTCAFNAFGMEMTA